MLEFQPRKDIIAWELCQVFRLTGSIAPGVQVHAMQLEGKGPLMRHFVCPYTNAWKRIEDAVDCQECEYCDWASLLKEWKAVEEVRKQ